MPGLPAFDGDISGWCLVTALFCAGGAAAIIGWARLNLGLGACGMIVLAIAGLWIAPALAQETGTQAPGADLGALLQAAQARVDREQADLAAWADALQHRADPNAGQAAAVEAASRAQLRHGAAMMDDPALRGAAVAPGAGADASANTGGVYVAVSLSMPPEALRQLARDAHRAGARVVIRGLVDGSFKATMLRVRQIFDDRSAGGVAIDPQVFKVFNVTAVPTVIAAGARVEPCGSLGCTPTTPAFDKISGNISLDAALRALEDEGSSGQAAAHAARARLAG
jgi:conjugal transfer pilus assembly protein TrbC